MHGSNHHHGREREASATEIEGEIRLSTIPGTGFRSKKQLDNRLWRTDDSHKTGVLRTDWPWSAREGRESVQLSLEWRRCRQSIKNKEKLEEAEILSRRITTERQMMFVRRKFGGRVRRSRCEGWGGGVRLGGALAEMDENAFGRRLVGNLRWLLSLMREDDALGHPL